MQVIDFTTDGLTLAIGWGVLALIALLGVCLIGLWRAARRERGALAALADRANDHLAAYGFWRWPRWLLLGVGFLWLALFLAVILGMVWVPLRLGLQDLSAETVVDLRWFLLTLTALVAALGGLIALPFTFLRTAFNARQTRTAEQSHITDQITKAVEALGAEKTVSRIGRIITVKAADGRDTRIEWKGEPLVYEGDEEIEKIGDWQALEETVPNREVRIGGIYALERIAQDSLRDHVQIMEILTAYIRENAKAEGLAPLVPALDPLPDDATPKARAAHLKAVEERAERIRKAADALEADTVIQAAIQVIARREERQKDEEKADTRYGDDSYRLDLRGTNLRAVDISGLDLSRARLEGAHPEGAGLVGAHLERARLRGASLQGAVLGGADLKRAYFKASVLQNASVKSCDLSETRLDQDQVNATFGDGSVTDAMLPPGVTRPPHWPGADLDVVDFLDEWRRWQADPEGYAPP